MMNVSIAYMCLIFEVKQISGYVMKNRFLKDLYCDICSHKTTSCKEIIVDETFPSCAILYPK